MRLSWKLFLTRLIKNYYSLNSNSKNDIVIVKAQQLCDIIIRSNCGNSTNFR